MAVEITDFFPPVFVFIQIEKDLVLHAEVIEPYSQLWTGIPSTLGFHINFFPLK